MSRRFQVSLLVVGVLAIAGRAYAAPVSAPELDADQMSSGIALAGATLLLLSHRRLRALTER